MRELLADLVSVGVVAQTVRMAVPYVCAGLGGIWSERSGVVNIGLEGILLAGGFSGVVAQVATGSALAGLIAGAVTGAAVGAVHALIVVYGRVDAVVSGVAINLATAGGTRFALRVLYASSSNSPTVRGFSDLMGAPSGRAQVVRAVLDPMTLGAVLLAAWTIVALAQTRWGLRVRACGENPAAAVNAGLDVRGIRFLAVSLGGAITGLGGVALAYDEHQFQSGMSNGRGFIALAAVILSGWRPGRAVIACFAFAALDAVQILVQEETGTVASVAPMLPYVATLVALSLVAIDARRRGPMGRAGAPAALGRQLE